MTLFSSRVASTKNIFISSPLQLHATHNAAETNRKVRILAYQVVLSAIHVIQFHSTKLNSEGTNSKHGKFQYEVSWQIQSFRNAKWNVFERTFKGQETNREADPDRLHSYERNLACRLGGPGIALQAALSLAKEGYQEMGSSVEHMETGVVGRWLRYFGSVG